jgi:hypothetical protein
MTQCRLRGPFDFRNGVEDRRSRFVSVLVDIPHVPAVRENQAVVGGPGDLGGDMQRRSVFRTLIPCVMHAASRGVRRLYANSARKPPARQE